MGQLGFHHDSCVTKRLFETASPGSIVHLATGYFNLTQDYTVSIVDRSAAAYNILMAHPTVSITMNDELHAGLVLVPAILNTHHRENLKLFPRTLKGTNCCGV
jgi:hypothetical protein